VFKLNGLFDRVDYLPEKDIVRIVDYKTGKVDLKSYIDVETAFADDKYKESFQGYMYAWLYDQKHPDQQIQVGYYTVRHLSAGINYLNGGKVVSREELDEFEVKIKELINRILEEDFSQTEDESKCSYCSYKGICNR
ncbi:MAG: PD-(D/E)XK nuclease family protein, partial [Bacteroidetes bacterium]|nr:PD-(D/E)XK nuclease family protein [Bacteroidota bacterium]